MILTTHAIDQFRDRWRPDLSWTQAARELERLAESAMFVTRSALGDPVWMSEGVPMVVKHDDDGSVVCVTVLAPVDTRHQERHMMIVRAQLDYDESCAVVVRIRKELDNVRVRLSEIQVRLDASIGRRERLRVELDRLLGERGAA